MGGGNYSERRVLFCWAAAAGGWRNKRSSDCWIAGLKLNYRNVESCWILLVTTATPGKSLESDWDVKRMMFAAAGMTEKWERSDRDRRLFLFEHEWMREQKSFLFWMNPNQSLSRANKTTVGRLHTTLWWAHFLMPRMDHVTSPACCRSVHYYLSPAARL